MSRLAWSRYSGDDFEAVIGICLCRENPKATRVRPSKGDKGIDVLAPGADGWVVYQVKSFTGKFTSSQKSQIKKSWANLRKYLDQRGITLEEWYLVTPESPTTERLEWLEEEVTGSVEIPTIWKGEDFVDSLAARFPDVIDYYLRGGKDRLEESVREFLGALSIESAVSLDAAGSIDRLVSLHKIVNRFDPHYTYDLSVEAIRSDMQKLSMQETAGCLVAIEQASEEHRVVVKVRSRYAEATKDRPVPGMLQVTLPGNSDESAAFEDFIEYGTPYQSPEGAGNVVMDLPGGLGGEFRDVAFWVGPSPSAETSRPLQLDLFRPDGGKVAGVVLDMEPGAAGLSGVGRYAAGTERGGAFRFEMRYRIDEQSVKMSFKSLDVTGKRPSDVLAGLTFLHNFLPPNQLEVRIESGPSLVRRQAIETALSGVEEANEGLLAVQALAVIQKFTGEDIRVPDLASTRFGELDTWRRAAILLEGGTLPVEIDRLPVCLGGDSRKLASGGALAVRSPFVVTIGGKKLDFGFNILHITAVKPTVEGDLRPHDDHFDVDLFPAEGATVAFRWVNAQLESELGPGTDS